MSIDEQILNELKKTNLYLEIFISTNGFCKQLLDETTKNKIEQRIDEKIKQIELKK
jgi:hypothetical protein